MPELRAQLLVPSHGFNFLIGQHQFVRRQNAPSAGAPIDEQQNGYEKRSGDEEEGIEDLGEYIVYAKLPEGEQPVVNRGMTKDIIRMTKDTVISVRRL